MANKTFIKVRAYKKLDLPVDLSRTAFANQRGCGKETVKTHLERSGNLYEYLYGSLRDDISVTNASDTLPAELLPLLDACMVHYQRLNKKGGEVKVYSSFDTKKNTDPIFWHLVDALLKRESTSPISFFDVCLLKDKIALVSGTDHLCGDSLQARFNIVSKLVRLSPPASYPQVMTAALRHLDEAALDILQQIGAGGNYHLFGDHCEGPSDSWEPLNWSQLEEDRQLQFGQLNPLNSLCDRLLEIRKSARELARDTEMKKLEEIGHSSLKERDGTETDEDYLVDFLFPLSPDQSEQMLSFEQYLSSLNTATHTDKKNIPLPEELRTQYDLYLLSLTSQADRDEASKSLQNLYQLKEYMASASLDKNAYKEALTKAVWELLSPGFSNQTGTLEPTLSPTLGDQIQFQQARQIYFYLLSVFEEQFRAIDRFQAVQLLCSDHPSLCNSAKVIGIAMDLNAHCGRLINCLGGLPNFQCLSQGIGNLTWQHPLEESLHLDVEEYVRRLNAVVAHLNLQPEQLENCDISPTIGQELVNISRYLYELGSPSNEHAAATFVGVGRLLQALLFLTCLEAFAAQIDLACHYREDLQSARAWLCNQEK